MIVLLYAAETAVTFATVWCVWTGRRLWLYGQRPALRATVMVQVVRPIRIHTGNCLGSRQRLAWRHGLSGVR
jgi:hypothetical protein